MGKPVPDQQKQLDISFKTAQYFASLTSQQDVWSEVGKVMINFYNVDLFSFAKRQSDGEIIGNHWILPDKVSCERILTAKTKEIINEVMESGFLATYHIDIPAPYSLVFLPVEQKDQTPAVILVGHEMSEPLPKEIINVYLAVAGLIGITVTKWTSEAELKATNQQLRASEQQLKASNQQLRANERQLRVEIAQRKQAEKRIIHLNAVLKAIRKVNQLIIKVKDREKLLQDACNNLIKTRGYHSAWIALMEENGRFVTTAQAGVDKDFPAMIDKLKCGELTRCIRQAIEQPGIVVVANPAVECSDCPLVGTCAGQAGAIARLEYEGRVYGFFTVTVPVEMAADEEERSLFVEVADDIAFALHTIEAKAEHKHLESQLRQAQKMEAIGLLAGGIAHDFNNILTAIQGYTDLALTEIQEDNPLYQDIKEIQKASMRAANLTRQLLLFSRRQPMEYTLLDLNKVINDLIKMLRRLISEDISLTTDLASDPWTVKGDAGASEQVIMNLVVNARDAMPKGGEITIKTENLYIDEEYCKACRDARPGEFVCLSVRDTGVGIDQSIIDRIFEPFFTTKEVGKATGMGLSVVYGIVKQHEGWVNVESSPGKGSIFRTYLPAVSMEPEEKEKESVSSEEFIGKGERILLVEDEESIRDLTKRVFTKNGYVVFTATNVQEALDIFQKEKGNFDLIFSDIVLPDGRGPELLEEILKLKPKISVLLTSGYSDEKLDWSAMRKGDYHYLQKPYSLSDLLRVVRDALKIKGT